MSVCSLTMQTHGKIFYFGKSKKLTIKVTTILFDTFKNCMFMKSLTTQTHAVIVVDYADTMLA